MEIMGAPLTRERVIEPGEHLTFWSSGDRQLPVVIDQQEIIGLMVIFPFVGTIRT